MTPKKFLAAEPLPDPLERKADTRTQVVLKAWTKVERDAKKIKWPAKSLQKFIIQRLIMPSNKAGGFSIDGKEEFVDGEWDPESQEGFDWRFGAMLLDLSKKTEAKREMRNAPGDTKLFSSRVLQELHLPWGLPSNIPFDTEGVPLKIAYPRADISIEDGGGMTFLAAEPVMILTPPGEDPDVLLPIIDFEGYRGETSGWRLVMGVDEVPWGVRVNKEWMEYMLQEFDDELTTWYQAGLKGKIIKAKNDAAAAAAAAQDVGEEQAGEKEGELVSEDEDEALLE